MLKQRIVTAGLLLVALLGALSVDEPWVFKLLTLLFLGAGVWEWMRLVGPHRVHPILIALAVSIVLAIASAYGLPELLRSAILSTSSVVWLGLGLMLIGLHRFPPVASCRPLFLLAGLVLPAAGWLALVDAFADGVLFMISIMALVWAADIGAYFSGRAFGKHKLAPSISPGKTWEGVAGAILCVWIVAALAANVHSLRAAFSSQLFAKFPWWVVLPLLALLIGMSVVGDLFESHLKRQAGVKDSSALLPGHGGVLDRIDSLLPVLPLALLIYRILPGM